MPHAPIIEFDFWTMLGIAVTCIGMLVGAFFALFKLLMLQHNKAQAALFKRFEERFTQQDQSLLALHGQLEERARNAALHEKELMQVRVDLANEYVRRDDFNRVIATFGIQLENLRLTIERVLLSPRNHK